MNNYQYPKTTLEATKVLINHRYHNWNQTKHHKKGQGQKNDTDEDKNENVQALAFMMYRRCYCCVRVGSKSPQFWYKYMPKSEWFIKK